MIDKLRSTTYNILRKSESFFQTDMVYLVKGGFWLVLGRIFSSLASFLLAIAFANLLPKEIYGTYKYVLSLIGMLSVFTLSGLNTSLTRSIARGFEGDFKNALTKKIKWGSLGSIISLGISGYYYLNGNITLTICFIIGAIFLPFMDSFNIYLSILNGRKRFKLNSKYNIIIQVIASLNIFLTLIFTKNIYIIIFIYFVSYTVLRLIFLKLTLKRLDLNNQKEDQTISYGKHLTVMNILGGVSQQIDKVLLWHFLGSASLAVYSISLSPVLKLREILKTTSVLALPKLSNEIENQQIFKKNLIKKIVKFTLLLIPIILIYIFLVPYLFQIALPNYMESIKFSKIYAWSLLVVPFTLISVYLQAQAQKKSLYIISIISPIVKILALAILLPIYGIMGAIGALLIYHLFTILITFYFFQKN